MIKEQLEIKKLENIKKREKESQRVLVVASDFGYRKCQNYY